MEALKKIFPFSFGHDTLAKLIIFVILYLLVIAILTAIPVIGWIASLYCWTGIALCFLSYFKLIK